MSPEGEQRPCYDAIRLQKIMLKFKGVKRVHVQKYSQVRYIGVSVAYLGITKDISEVLG